jgi:hypothetical protein
MENAKALMDIAGSEAGADHFGSDSFMEALDTWLSSLVR